MYLNCIPTCTLMTHYTDTNCILYQYYWNTVATLTLRICSSMSCSAMSRSMTWSCRNSTCFLKTAMAWRGSAAMPRQYNSNYGNYKHCSVLARGSCKEQCFLRDQSIVVVFFQPHQRKTIYLRAEEHRSLAL